MNLVLAVLFITNAHVTAYRSVKSQTDDSPYFTSIGERTNVHGCAVSQDLLKANGGPLSYGDLLYIDGVGFRFVNDCMNKRHRASLDVWCETKDQEHKFYKKFKNKSVGVWLVKRNLSETEQISKTTERQSYSFERNLLGSGSQKSN